MAIKESYRDNPLLKRVGIEVQYTEEQVDEYIKCAKDPIYFSKYINIITLDEGLVPFKMYDFQKDMIKTFHQNRFVITKCPRQVGKTTTAVAYLLCLQLFQKYQRVRHAIENPAFSKARWSRGSLRPRPKIRAFSLS